MNKVYTTILALILSLSTFQSQLIASAPAAGDIPPLPPVYPKIKGVIDLSGKNLDDAGITEQAAKWPGDITGLILSRNNIGDEGLKAIVNRLRDNPINTLKILDLSNNKIGNQGVIALANHLAQNLSPNLTDINLGSNVDIGPEGKAALTGAGFVNLADNVWTRKK